MTPVAPGLRIEHIDGAAITGSAHGAQWHEYAHRVPRWFWELMACFLANSFGQLEESFVQMSGIPFGTTDWSKIPRTEHKGEHGCAYWRTQHFGAIRVRMVEYTPGYLADHWCVKGHILLCMQGELHTELEDGRNFTLKAGMSYQVADNAEAHRSSTVQGATLFIVD